MVIGGILKRDELAAIGQGNRIIERSLPTRLAPDGQRRIPGFLPAARIAYLYAVQSR